MNTVKSLTDFYYQVAIIILQALAPIVIFIVLIAIIKILYQYRKYGYSIFDVFRKREPFHFSQEFLFMIVDRLTVYKRLTKRSDLNANLVMITETGIYLFLIYDFQGTVIGNYKDKMLSHVKKNGTEPIPIQNPFLLIEEDEKKILSIIPHAKVFKYIILNDQCSFNILYKEEVKVTRFYKLFYNITSSTSQNPIYTKSEVNQIDKKISKE